MAEALGSDWCWISLSLSLCRDLYRVGGTLPGHQRKSLGGVQDMRQMSQTLPIRVWPTKETTCQRLKGYKRTFLQGTVTPQASWSRFLDRKSLCSCFFGLFMSSSVQGTLRELCDHSQSTDNVYKTGERMELKSRSVTVPETGLFFFFVLLSRPVLSCLHWTFIMQIQSITIMFLWLRFSLHVCMPFRDGEGCLFSCFVLFKDQKREHVWGRVRTTSRDRSASSHSYAKGLPASVHC